MPPAFVADRRLYLTADRSRIVEEGDPAAAFLLVAAGRDVPVADAARYGLTLDAQGVVEVRSAAPPSPQPELPATPSTPVKKPATKASKGNRA